MGENLILNMASKGKQKVLGATEKEEDEVLDKWSDRQEVVIAVLVKNRWYYSNKIR